MRTYATVQLIGSRSHQCDATAVRTLGGARAYVLLDGIGSSDEVREWTRAAAIRVARTAARHGDAETGLRAVHDAYAAEPERRGPFGSSGLPKAAAVVAVTAPGRPLTVAWCGDSRAYLIADGTARCLTRDHNLRRVFPPNRTFPKGGNRHVITSCLGDDWDDKQVMDTYNHPAIEAATVALPEQDCRLLLASDGAYEPIEDLGDDLAAFFGGTLRRAAELTAATAVHYAGARADNATALVADLS